MSAHRVSRSFILPATAGMFLLVSTLAFAARVEAPPSPPSPPSEPAAAPHAKAVTRIVHAGHGESGDHGNVKIEMDGGKMTVTSKEDGKVTTTVVDLDQVGDAVGEAMTALKDMQLQVRVGQDNRVDVSTDDGTYQVDIDRIVTQVAAALQAGLKDADRDIDTHSWTSHGPRDARDEAELRRELADLQKEMSGLREELHRLNAGKSEK